MLPLPSKANNARYTGKTNRRGARAQGHGSRREYAQRDYRNRDTESHDHGSHQSESDDNSDDNDSQSESDDDDSRRGRDSHRSTTRQIKEEVDEQIKKQIERGILKRSSEQSCDYADSGYESENWIITLFVFSTSTEAYEGMYEITINSHFEKFEKVSDLRKICEMKCGFGKFDKSWVRSSKGTLVRDDLMLQQIKNKSRGMKEGIRRLTMSVLASSRGYSCNNRIKVSTIIHFQFRSDPFYLQTWYEFETTKADVDRFQNVTLECFLRSHISRNPNPYLKPILCERQRYTAGSCVQSTTNDIEGPCRQLTTYDIHPEHLISRANCKVYTRNEEVEINDTLANLFSQYGFSMHFDIYMDITDNTLLKAENHQRFVDTLNKKK